MGLQEAIKELDEEIKASMEETDKASEVVVEQEAEDVAEEVAEEVAVEEAAEVEQEVKVVDKVEEEKLDSSAYARMRMEKAAAQRKADMLEAELKAAKEAKEVKPKAVSEEPDAELDPEAHLRWELAETKKQLKEVADWKEQISQKERNASLREGAVNAFVSYEDAFSPTVKDYAEVTAFGVEQLATSISRLNPHLTGKALSDTVQKQVLIMAGQAESQGFDPAEYFYNQSKKWGYQPKAEAKAQEKIASVKNIVSHKKAAPSSLTSGGRSGKVPLSKEAFESMNFSDLAKLTPAELRELESM